MEDFSLSKAKITDDILVDLYIRLYIVNVSTTSVLFPSFPFICIRQNMTMQSVFSCIVNYLLWRLFV